ncbi:OOP family OmpA-OmpF porin [Rhodovulum iodosum]|uniref:OOP family OmpA-OmpF porin n=1 Tax=Rhodovulum iodosum TaxID=68291 RepID=A0ABV3XR61_9RHOB|nr:OmpA family protein [Rhodovulum robiginosum]RSK32773.1 OmpA family protein [Rhodovulum robiginosum]
MRLSANLIAGLAIALAALLSFAAATVAVTQIETRSAAAVERILLAEGIDWAAVETNGLRMTLSGTAPDEAARFNALSLAGQVVESSRLIDAMDVTPSEPIAPPLFSLELLRNDQGVSMIGLIPGDGAHERIAAAVQERSAGQPVTDMLDVADHPVPAAWPDALEFGLAALERLERAKISISAERVAVTAIADSLPEKRKLETALARRAPEGLEISLDISAPRPVITPFTLRFLIDEDGTRFDACSADTQEAADRIIAAAVAAGFEGKVNCILGLGTPSPRWGAAVETGIAALAELGRGTLTFSDADVTLVAADDVPQALFDRVVGELDSALPEVFSLHAVLPEPVKVDGSGDERGPAEFYATLSPEGLVQLRGRIPDAIARGATESYARSRFGPGNVYAAMRLDSDLPEGWPLRVLAGLAALSDLRNGVVIVQRDYLRLSGTSLDENAGDRITRELSDKLGEAQNFELDIRYEKPPAEPEAAAAIDPETCVARINEIIGTEKITFEPGATTLGPESVGVVNRIAREMRTCPDAEMEIGGHTDSQGRAEMNLDLSQKRAEAVLNALMARRVLVGNLTARGYGETEPVADNGTEEGREANRRIEFRLIGDNAPPAEDETADAGSEEDTADDAAEDAGTEAEAATEGSE